MIQLGVTGGIGSGKTTVCMFLERLSIPVFYADEEAKKLYDKPEFIQILKNEFGKVVLDNKGNINKKAIADLVFNHPERLKKLNSLIHPEVANQYKIWLSIHKKYSIVAKEAAILFESGSYKEMDKIVCVYAPKALRLKRSMQRSQSSKEEILKRMKQQLPEKEKMLRADFVLYNNEKKLLLPQVLKLVNQLKKS